MRCFYEVKPSDSLKRAHTHNNAPSLHVSLAGDSSSRPSLPTQPHLTPHPQHPSTAHASPAQPSLPSHTLTAQPSLPSPVSVSIEPAPRLPAAEKAPRKVCFCVFYVCVLHRHCPLKTFLGPWKKEKECSTPDVMSSHTFFCPFYQSTH